MSSSVDVPARKAHRPRSSSAGRSFRQDASPASVSPTEAPGRATASRETETALQRLTLTLDGITAGDYLAWVRDPEPPALDRDLRAISVQADPLGDTIEAALSWTLAPPAPLVAARAAGLPLTPEVIAVKARQEAAAA